MLRGEPKGQASPVSTGRPSSPLSSLSEDQDPGAVEPRARPRGPTAPRRPSSALGQHGPLGPAPLRGASCTQSSWEGATTTTLAPWTSGEPNERARQWSRLLSPARALLAACQAGSAARVRTQGLGPPKLSS